MLMIYSISFIDVDARFVLVYSVILKEPIDEGFFGQVYKAVLVTTKNGKKVEVDAAVKTLKSKLILFIPE